MTVRPMQGEELGDVIQSGVEAGKNAFAPRNGNNAARAMLRKFGACNAVKVWVHRKPIDGVLNSVLSFISLGQAGPGRRRSTGTPTGCSHLAPSSC